MRNIFLWIHREVIFDVLCIQREHIELLHEADHLRTAEVTKRVAGQAQTNRRGFVSGRPFLSECQDGARCNAHCRNECTGANKIATGENVFHKQPVARRVAPSPSRTRAPTSSSLPGRLGSVRLSCRASVRGEPPTRG
jgi:hypothetical protein